MKENLRIANVILGVVNIILFTMWLSMIRKDSLPLTGEPSNYIINQLSIGVAVLSVIVTVAALILGGLSIFGYQAVVERAERRADSTAREVATRLFAELANKDSFTVMKTSNKGPLQNVETATKAED
jgi:hypothetical protein